MSHKIILSERLSVNFNFFFTDKDFLGDYGVKDSVGPGNSAEGRPTQPMVSTNQLLAVPVGRVTYIYTYWQGL